MRSVRAPADPADFETTLSRPPLPPLEFTVKASGDSLVIEVLEPVSPPARPTNTGYRVVLAPSSLIPSRAIRQVEVGALADLGETVALLPAANDGGRQRIVLPGRSGDRGWYLCLPIGQRGVRGEPTGIIRSPWGL